MKSYIGKETAERRVVQKFDKLYIPLMDLVAALQNLEPGGTLVDEAVITRKVDSGVRIEYKARPVSLTILDGKRRFTLSKLQ